MGESTQTCHSQAAGAGRAIPIPAVQPYDEVKGIPLREDRPERTVRIGTRPRAKLEGEFLAFLRGNADVFSWELADMPGIPKELKPMK